MSNLVIDASFVAALMIASQRTQAAVELASAWDRHTVFAPYVFSLEVPWLLLRNERRTGQRGYTAQALARLSRYAIKLANAPDEFDRAQALDAALRLNAGFYDAMYVVLAREIGARLVTRDGGMITTAERLGVSVMDVR